MSRLNFQQWLKHIMPGRKTPRATHHRGRMLAMEQLCQRITPTVNAFFAGGTLTVLGDNSDNTVEVGRNAAGMLSVNGDAVQIYGGTPTVANTRTIQIFGLGGHDHLALNEANGALPRANLFGGAGNDTYVLGRGHGADTVTENDSTSGNADLASFLAGAPPRRASAPGPWIFCLP